MSSADPLVQWLKNAHSLEQALISTLEDHAREAGEQAMARGLAEQLPRAVHEAIAEVRAEHGAADSAVPGGLTDA